MSGNRTYILIPDSHANPDHLNTRADYLSKLIIDIKPDVVVNMGDQFDMQSLSSYDKGKRAFQGRSYKKDVDSGLEFHDRVWGPVKATKKKLPYTVYLIGNHEERIDRALDLSPELEGTIGYKDLDLERYYDDVVHYSGSTPGVIELDGILFAHFYISGIMGRPTGGEHPAHMLLSKVKQSAVAGHSHLLDVCFQTTQVSKPWNGLITGCYLDYVPSWAGNQARLWKSGVSVLRNVDNGNFDFQWISLESLKQEYS